MILLDTSHLFFRNVFIHQKYLFDENNSKSFEGLFAHIFINSIISNVDKFKASKNNRFILAIDGKNSWRKQYFLKNNKNFPEYKEIAKGYKGQRKKDEKIDWDKLFEIYDEILDYLDKYSDLEVINVEYAEADDVIAIGVKYFKNNENIVIVSSDKDFKQLIDLKSKYKVRLYDPIMKQYKDENDPKLYLQKQIIIGDKIDNILPIKKRIGEKTAEKIIESGLNEWLEINDLKDRYEFNKKLIDLSQIPENIENKILEKYKNIKYNYNEFEISKLFSKYKLSKLFEKIGLMNLNNKKNFLVFNDIQNKKEKDFLFE